MKFLVSTLIEFLVTLISSDNLSAERISFWSWARGNSPIDWLSVTPLSVELVLHKQPLLSTHLSSSGRDSRPPRTGWVPILFPHIPVLSPRLSFPDCLPFSTK